INWHCIFHIHWWGLILQSIKNRQNRLALLLKNKGHTSCRIFEQANVSLIAILDHHQNTKKTKPSTYAYYWKFITTAIFRGEFTLVELVPNLLNRKTNTSLSGHHGFFDRNVKLCYWIDRPDIKSL
ncbi:hypothetical protein ACJX0J_029724, partial [Zea mays]